MKISSKIIITDKVAFYCIYCFYAVTNILFWDSGLGDTFSIVGTFLKLSNYITILLLMSFIGLRIICRRKFHVNSFKRAALLTGYVAASAMVLLMIKSSGFLILILCIAVPLFCEFDIEELIKFDFRLKVVLFVLIIGLSLVGVLKNVSGNYNGTFKQSFGFHHPNAFGMYAFTLLIEWLYLRFEKLTLIECGIIFMLGYLTMEFSGARTTSYMFFAIFLLFLLAKLFPKLFTTKFVQFGTMLLAPFLMILSIVLTKLFIQHDRLAIQINAILSDRLDYQAVYWKTFGVRFFGQNIFFKDVMVNGTKSSILDCAYIQILLYYGLIFSVIFIFLFALMFYFAVERNNVKMIVAVLFFVGTGFAESSMLRPFLNPFIFALLAYPIPKRKKITPDSLMKLFFRKPAIKQR